MFIEKTAFNVVLKTSHLPWYRRICRIFDFYQLFVPTKKKSFLLLSKKTYCPIKIFVGYHMMIITKNNRHLQLCHLVRCHVSRSTENAFISRSQSAATLPSFQASLVAIHLRTFRLMPSLTLSMSSAWVSDTSGPIKIAFISLTSNFLILEIAIVSYEPDDAVKEKKMITLTNEVIPFYLTKFNVIAKENNGHLALNRVSFETFNLWNQLIVQYSSYFLLDDLGRHLLCRHCRLLELSYEDWLARELPITEASRPTSIG